MRLVYWVNDWPLASIGLEGSKVYEIPGGAGKGNDGRCLSKKKKEHQLQNDIKISI